MKPLLAKMKWFLYLTLFLVGYSQFTTRALGAAPFVHELTVAAPDIIRIEIRESPVQYGQIIKMDPSVSPNKNGWATLPDGQAGIVIGPQKRHLRLTDSTSGPTLNRELVDQAEDYGQLGSKRIIAVYRKSVPWSSGTAGNASLVSFAHFIYLKLNAPLDPGRYEIHWPKNILPATSFEFRDTHTRASSIRANQIGHSPNDTSKYAYLALWLPNGPGNGAVDFRTYGLSEFEVINEEGERVFANRISLRLGPEAAEPGNGISEGLITYTRSDKTVFQANRAGTFVFGLDYSGWRHPPPGTYRLKITGLGVSDPFEIAEDIWHRAAQISMAGLYHHRSGLVLDGRFGYSRPECFTQTSGVTVMQSRLPFALSREAGSFIPFTEGAKPPWITQNPVTDAWGGYHDAGDWDRRIQHVSASYLLLDVFEQLPEHKRNMFFSLPASGEVLSHPDYKGRNLPDIVDEAIWNLDFFRRLQSPDGGVSGGIESGGGPKKWEPCWLESNTVFAYAADPNSSYVYAAGAGKLAIVLEHLGESKLSELFSESALRAWNWAEKQRVTRNKGYSAALSLLEPLNDNQKTHFENVVREQADSRLWAAAALFRLTGDERFQSVVENRFSSWVDMQGYRLHAGWEYLNTIRGGRSRAALDHIRSEIVRLADEFILLPQKKWSYKSLKHRGAPMMWGEGLAPTVTELTAIIRAHKLTAGRKQFSSAMLDASAHILGANQIGMSFTTGLGHRWPKAPLHEDSIAAGIPAPAGITIYGWAHPIPSNYWWLWGPSWAALSQEVPTKRVEPIRTSLPIYEYLIEHPRLIMSSEYTVHQTIATTAAMWIYLDGLASRKNH